MFYESQPHWSDFALWSLNKSPWNVEHFVFYSFLWETHSRIFSAMFLLPCNVLLLEYKNVPKHVYVSSSCSVSTLQWNSCVYSSYTMTVSQWIGFQCLLLSALFVQPVSIEIIDTQMLYIMRRDGFYSFISYI